MWKKKLYEMTVEGESDTLKKTMYQVLFCGEERLWWQKVFSIVTPAGKPRYNKPLSNVTVTPMEVIKQRIEEKIGELMANNKDFAEQFRRQPDRVETTSNNNPNPVVIERANNIFGYADEPAAPVIQHAAKTTNNQKEADKKELQAAKKERCIQSAKQRENVEVRIQEMKHTSRWLPDSAITTYFGKPAFHAYGNANTNPTNGGTIYGDYLKTHNVNPHSGDNVPEFKQVFERAIIGGATKESILSMRAKSRSPIKRQVAVR